MMYVRRIDKISICKGDFDIKPFVYGTFFCCNFFIKNEVNLI